MGRTGETAGPGRTDSPRRNRHRPMSTFLGRGNSRQASGRAHSTRGVPAGPGEAEETRRRPKVRKGRRGGGLSGEPRHRLTSTFLGRGNSRQPSGGAIRRGGCPLGPETRRARRKRGENQTEKRLNRRRGSPKRNEVRKGRRGSGVPGETRSGEGEEPGGRRGREGWEGVETAAAGGYQLAGAGVRAGGRRRPRCWRGRPSLPAGRAID